MPSLVAKARPVVLQIPVKDWSNQEESDGCGDNDLGGQNQIISLAEDPIGQKRGTSRMEVYLARPASPRMRPSQIKYLSCGLSSIFLTTKTNKKIKTSRMESGKSIRPSNN
jgi:hypothetical protein